MERSSISNGVFVSYAFNRYVKGTLVIPSDRFYLWSSLDLVISCLGLHWTNDLPGAMIQVCVSCSLSSTWVLHSFLLSILLPFIYFLHNSLGSWYCYVHLWQCRLGLKPDGLFLAAILGGETLKLFNPISLEARSLRFSFKFMTPDIFFFPFVLWLDSILGS